MDNSKQILPVQGGEFRAGLLEDGDIALGVLPQGQEVLVSRASLGAANCDLVALGCRCFEGIGAPKAKMGQGADRLISKAVDAESLPSPNMP